MRVDLGDGVGVDAKGDGQLTDGGQLVAGLQPVRRDRDADTALELRVQRHRVAHIDGAGPVPVGHRVVLY